MCLNFRTCACHIPSTSFLSSIMSMQPIDWSKVPHTELVSDSEDDAEVAEVKVEHQRQKEVSNKCTACCGGANNNWHRHEK